MYKSSINFSPLVIISSLIATLSLTGCSNLREGPQPQNITTSPPPVLTTPSVDPSLTHQIQQDIANWRLTSPVGNNAAEKLAKLRKQDPYNSAIAGIETQIAYRYIQLANKTLAKQATPSSNTLKKALGYIKTARSVAPNSTELDKKEKQINDLININAQKRQLQQARAKAKEKARKKQLEEQQARALAASTDKEPLQDVSKPPPSLSMASPTPKIPTSTDDLLIFKQADVDNQSLTLGLELEKLSRRIVERKSQVIVHAQSEKDYRWINGSLKTYVYLLDSSFHLNSTAKIGPLEYPGIELVQ